MEDDQAELAASAAARSTWSPFGLADLASPRWVEDDLAELAVRASGALDLVP